MKHCGNCGKEIGDNTKFCPACGAKVLILPPQPDYAAQPTEQSNPNHSGMEPLIPTPPPTKKKRSKGLWIAAGILLLVLVVAVAGGILAAGWYNSAEQQAIRALNAGDYDNVQELIEENLSVFNSQEVNDWLQARIESIQAGFLDESITYASAKMELESIAELEVNDLSDKLTEASELIDRVNQSRADYATAESFYASEDYEEAIHYYQLVVEDDSNYEAAVAKLAEAINAYRDGVMADAAQSAEAGEFFAAVTKLNTALLVIPNDAGIMEQIRLYEQQGSQQKKEDALATASSYAASGNYYEAYQSLEILLQSQPEDEDLLLAYNSYYDSYVDSVKAEAEAQAESGEYAAAIATIEAAIDKLDEDDELNDALAHVQDLAFEYMCDVIYNAADNGDWESALEFISAFESEYPQEQRLEDVRVKIEEEMPDALADITVISSDRMEILTSVMTDRWGNVYDGAVRFYTLRNGFALYNLNGAYTSFSATIFVPKEESNGINMSVAIYVDEELAYYREGITEETAPFLVEISIAGATTMRIVTDYTDLSYGHLCFANARLEKVRE